MGIELRKTDQCRLLCFSKAGTSTTLIIYSLLDVLVQNAEYTVASNMQYLRTCIASKRTI